MGDKISETCKGELDNTNINMEGKKLHNMNSVCAKLNMNTL